MDQKTCLLIELTRVEFNLIELTLFTGGSIHVYDKRGDLQLVIAKHPETD